MANILSVHGADMFIGETRVQGFTVTHDGVAVTPVNATYQRYLGATAIDVAPVAATIDSNSVYANVPAGSTAGQFNTFFYFTVDSQTVTVRVQYRVLPKP